MLLRAIVISLLVFANIQSADAANVPETLVDFGGSLSAGMVKCSVNAEITGDQLKIRLGASYSSLPGELHNRNVTPFDWKRVKVWVVSQEGKTAASLPLSEQTFSIGGPGGAPGVVWNLNLGFENAKQAAAVVLQVDSTFQVFPLPLLVK